MQEKNMWSKGLFRTCSLYAAALFLSAMMVSGFAACDNDADEIVENETVTIDGTTYEVVELPLTRQADTPFDGERLPAAYPLDFYLRNESTQEVATYQTTLYYDGEKVHCDMLVPQDRPLADGEYKLLMVVHGAKKRFPFTMKLTFQNRRCIAVGEFTPLYGRKLGSSSAEEPDGSAGHPLLIKNYTDLIRLHADLKDDLTKAEGIYFRQERTIDLNDYYADPNRDTEQGWSPIAPGFAGHYNGNNKTIRALVYNGSRNGVGLFESLGDGAEIYDLVFSDIAISTPADCVGAVAGSATGNVTLSNITVKGNIAGGSKVGGLIGAAENATLHISLSANEGLAIEGSNQAGGFVGYVSGLVDISACTIGARVESAGDYVGGTVGYISGNGTHRFHDINNKSSHLIEGRNNIGSIAGYVSGGILGSSLLLDKAATSLESNFAVAATGSNCGGLFGEAHTSGELKLENCYVQMAISGADNTGGYIGRLAGASTASLTDCDTGSKGRVKGTSYVGGVIGKSETRVNITFSNGASNRYELPVEGSVNFAGGVFGRLSGATLTNVVAAANVTGEQRVGGFFGEGDNPSFTNCRTDSLIRVLGKLAVGGWGGSVSSPTISEGTVCAALVNPDESYSKAADNVGGLFGYAHSVTLKNITVKSKVNGKYAVGGLIGQADKDINLSYINNYSPVNGNERVGGIIGHSFGSSLNMEHVCNYAKIDCNEPCAGGLVGLSSVEYSIKYGHNYAEVSGGGNCVGGIMGHGGGKGTIENCTNTGEISGANYVGGILGSTGDNNKERQIELHLCANGGRVEAGTKGVGGIAGYIHGHLKITECYNTGYHTGNENIGGILGEMTGYYNMEAKRQVINDCYNSADSAGKKHRGGILGYKGSDAGINSMHMYRCCNYGSTGYGSIGGLSNRASYNYGSIYYVDTNKDDFPYDTHRYSLQKLKEMNVSSKLGDKWKDGPDGLPMLKNAPAL